MKLSMSSLDIMVCVRELKKAVGARVDKVYELAGAFVLQLRVPERGRQDLLIEPGRRVHLTGVEYKFPKQPSMYAMLLRKHLANAQLVAVGQPGFERIVEFEFQGREKHVLIAELFGAGNLVLCDETRTIVQPYRSEAWRHRVIKAGTEYKYPPSRGDIHDLNLSGLSEALAGAPDVVRGLAVNLGVGGQLAEEICARAKVNKTSALAVLSEAELKAVLDAASGLLNQEPSPQIVHDDGKPVDVLPFDFAMYLGKRVKRFATFDEALDEYFSALTVRSAAAKQKERIEGKLEAIRKRLVEQEERLNKLEAEAVEAKSRADLITTHHALIDEALRRLTEFRRGGWPAATKKLGEAQARREPWAKPIKKVDTKTGAVEVELESQLIPLDLRVSSFENASKLYKRYKQMSEKAAGAREAVERTKGELERLSAEAEVEAPAPAVRRRRKLKWFERFKWFISSDGLLVIAGRDAATNREIVEKHMEPADRYLHADIVGAPYVVVKSAGKEVSQATLKEAAEFAAMHSRAWREGLGGLDVYWVLPEQVSKQAPSGEYLPRGSYMIRGKRNFLKVPVRAAVGVVTVEGEPLVVCGPLSVVEQQSKVAVQIVPGSVKKSDLARKVQAQLRAAGAEVSIDELMRALPPGKGEIKKQKL